MASPRFEFVEGTVQKGLTFVKSYTTGIVWEGYGGRGRVERALEPVFSAHFLQR